MRATWIGHMLRRNCLPKHVTEGQIEGQKWREEDGEDVRRYWMTSRNGEDTGKWKRKHYLALRGGLTVQRLWTCRKTGYGMNENEWDNGWTAFTDKSL